ncbi:ABC transporter permease subunit [Marinimicrobium sp. C6131]|uniref:ABC transporter permease subunit n=1 Tax=Marinimicrobium sp. C6131 TaxID=3022676 RepID=UPI00223E6D97|nr:ABC transporter permease subunit [Marinimicrobium sp. C6131]UZJ44841.1 ABC transporter permease subunit [Marinimicrobium sp. C6131]
MSERPSTPAHRGSLMPNAEQRARLRKVRKLKDSLSRYGVGTAGMMVVGALALIFIYLFSEVAPLLRSSSIEPTADYPFALTSPADPSAHLVLERYEEMGASFSEAGQVHFFNVDSGLAIKTFEVPRNEGVAATAVDTSVPNQQLVAYGFSDGSVSVVQESYSLSYPNDQRLVTPGMDYPLGEEPVTLDEQGRALREVAVQSTDAGIMVAGVTEDNQILVGRYRMNQGLFGNGGSVSGDSYSVPSLPGGAQVKHMIADAAGRFLVVADDREQLHFYHVERAEDARLIETLPTERGQVTALEFLVGTLSVIVGTEQGSVSQWFIIRDDNNQFHLEPVRDFGSLSGSVTAIAPEYTRKGFAAGDDQGNVGLFYGTSSSTLVIEPVTDQPISQLALSPINGRLLALDNDQRLHIASVWNEHPEISMSSLWQKVWYEGRQQPEYVWQASSGADDSEAKMSLVPLSIGTLKAAFYAMLFAIPLGVMGAIYTAYFMTPKLRGVVKPTIEIMEALPTVILGFLAGLWLAPFLENHLPAVFSILIFLPFTMLAVGLLWSRLPSAIRSNVPEGWEAAILIVPILLTGWACIAISPHVEVWFFDGSMRQWLTNNNIDYDQRNALIVGIAMGFAVIPTIFSIAEDAVFNVPRHLTQGSLALGATRWQTVVGVILPTASPGIFSAVMMGFGRAVGETMIVLMATGNSPVLNFNIFEGMRTLSANVAVELPETAIGSTHFRVLFLAALVLLALTFVVNTLAEVVRQRLRKRYSNL